MRTVELAVIGAGPAGLAVALEASQRGVETLILDENAGPGGRLRQQVHSLVGAGRELARRRGFEVAREWSEEARRRGAEIWCGAQVWGIFQGGAVEVYRGGRKEEVQARAIVLATGAAEEPAAFPGWTIPGIMNAGAVQGLLNLYGVLPGNRAVVYGTTDLGLVVAGELSRAGAEVTVVEPSAAVKGRALYASPLQRWGVSVLTGVRMVGARGQDRVEVVTLVREGGETREVAADLVCLAAGFVPATELAGVVGCRQLLVPALGGHVPVYDRALETTVEGLFVAGNAAGADELEAVILTGRLAGVSAAALLGRESPLQAERTAQETWTRIRQLSAGKAGRARWAARERLISNALAAQRRGLQGSGGQMRGFTKEEGSAGG